MVSGADSWIDHQGISTLHGEEVGGRGLLSRRGLSLVLVVGAGKGTQMERCTAVREYGVPEALWAVWGVGGGLVWVGKEIKGETTDEWGMWEWKSAAGHCLSLGQLFPYQADSFSLYLLSK